MKKTQSKFKIIIERDEDGFFVAAVPMLPGCHTQAKTLSELTGRVKDAIRLCLSVSKTDPKYQKKIKQLSYEPTFVGMDIVTI